ncbi:MAG: hypothetical protein R3C68_07520 [Myxococcota bacterium]
MKTSFVLNRRLSLGALIGVLVPTSPGGKGLKPASISFTALGIASMILSGDFELSLNLGYTLDQTASIFDDSITPA